jgi:hypothetical protein
MTSTESRLKASSPSDVKAYANANPAADCAAAEAVNYVWYAQRCNLCELSTA